MGPRPLLLTALVAAGLVAGCGSGAPEPAPTTPTTTPPGSPMTDDDSSCPPITGEQRLVTVALRNAAALPEGGRVVLEEVRPAAGGADASAVLGLTRTAPGCPPDSLRLDLLEGGGVTARGISVTLVAVTGPGAGGSVPTVQLRVGPPA